MNSVILSIGSNIGDRYSLLQKSLQEITIQLGKVNAISPIYESKALGFESEDLFLNMCIQIETPLTPIETLTILQDIEKKNGRVRFSNSSYSSRPLDIDIIFFNDLILDLPNLQIPHPRYTERLFVLIPLNEILKNQIDPRTFLTVAKVLSNCRDKSILTKYQF